MVDRRELERLFRTGLQSAGQRYEEFRRSSERQLVDARSEYQSAKHVSGVPTDDAGRAKVVCRRFAERRAAALDEEFRPACYEAGHPDCEGCHEDLREGRIETW
ncbi:DUF7091 family protein [Natronobiforma cellulositropha]|uniref:DUF7091 family protein n=1 Tax=Natronobiforma cellulositropha TaxID=1679076 RepID=UPI0021D5EF31|nr:hypothetical protein [Natronobiforma cellulositropha]